jgi:PPOX class probable F420-dependent enzyme
MTSIQDGLAAFDALADTPFVSFATFRKSGTRVATPVWIARDGDALIVTTPEDTGKVKRLRNSGRVELQVCNRMGKVVDDAPVVTGTAEILPDSDTARLGEVFRKKYGLEYRIFMLIERLVARRQKKRVIVRILPASAPPA